MGVTILSQGPGRRPLSPVQHPVVELTAAETYTENEDSGPSTHTDPIPSFSYQHFHYLVYTGNGSYTSSKRFDSIHLDEGKGLARCPLARGRPLVISVTRVISRNSPPTCDESDAPLFREMEESGRLEPHSCDLFLST